MKILDVIEISYLDNSNPRLAEVSAIIAGGHRRRFKIKIENDNANYQILDEYFDTEENKEKIQEFLR